MCFNGSNCTDLIKQNISLFQHVRGFKAVLCSHRGILSLHDEQYTFIFSCSTQVTGFFPPIYTNMTRDSHNLSKKGFQRICPLVLQGALIFPPKRSSQSLYIKTKNPVSILCSPFQPLESPFQPIHYKC